MPMIITNSIDKNEYHHFVLPNGLKVVLVNNPVFTKASCALSVNIGSHNDPDEYLGLSHFLEHMLFMGTEKYPNENGFSDFLSLHNGYTNAYTCHEMTVYYCDIDQEYLETMADMFSSFFTCPLFLKDSILRELSAVNSEALDQYNDKDVRMTCVLNEFAKKSDPRGRFTCGNAETLKHDNIWEIIVDFWKNHYSSDGMCLTVCGGTGIEKLKEIAGLFSNIKNNYFYEKLLPKYDDYCYFNPDFYKSIIQLSAVDDQKDLYISMNAPPALNEFKKNPYSYLNFLITSKEKNGIIHQLKSKKLATGIEFHWDISKGYTTLIFIIPLTDFGASNLQLVFNLLIGYLKTLKGDKYEYLRLKRIQDEEFMFKQNESPVEIAENLCAVMQKYPVENLLNYSYIHEEYDEKLINRILDHVSDFNKWIVLISNKNGKFDKKETYYSIPYTVLGSFSYTQSKDRFFPVNNDFVDFKEEAENREDFFLSDVTLINKDQSRFSKISEYENGKITYVYDQTYKVPKSIIHVILNNDSLIANYTSYLVFISLVQDLFNEENARLLLNSHLNISTSVEVEGVVIKIEGFSGNITNILLLFFEYLKKPDFERFDIIKRELLDEVSQILGESPYRRLSEEFTSNMTGSVTSRDIFSQLKDFKKEDCKFMDQYYTHIIAVGNIEYDEIENIFNKIKTEGKKPSRILGPCKNDVKFSSLDKNNNFAGILYETSDYNKVIEDYEARSINSTVDQESIVKSTFFKEFAIGKLIFEIAHEMFFNELRTEEELGYVVFCTILCFDKRNFLSFGVQSEKTVDFLIERILRFVRSLRDKIENMPEEEFNDFKESLIGFYMEPIPNLDSLSDDIYKKSTRMEVDLDLNSKIIAAIEEIDKNDLLETKMFESHYSISSFYSQE